MGRVYQYEKTGWWGVDYADVSGRRHRKVVAPTEKEARKLLSVLEAEAIKNRILGIQPIKRIRFSDFAEKFLDYCKKQMKCWNRYQSSLKSLKPIFDNLYLDGITAEKIDQYKMLRRDKVKPATINRDLQCFKRLFNLAITWGYARENPLKYVKFFAEPKGRLKYYTQDQIRKLLEVSPPHLRNIIIVAVSTGMRQNELLSLTWRDVDLENGFISVNDPKNSEPRKVLVLGKTKELLKTMRDTTQSTRVFCDAYGHSYAARTLLMQLKLALSTIGIYDMTFHDLRHTCATWMGMTGEQPQTIKDHLGHKDIRMTLRYTHISSDQKVNAVKKLDNFILLPEENGNGNNLAMEI